MGTLYFMFEEGFDGADHLDDKVFGFVDEIFKGYQAKLLVVEL